MPQLPIPGGDAGIWGSILNDFLEVSHNTDGTLVKSALQQAGAVTSLNGVSPTDGVLTVTAGDVNALPTTTTLAGLADTSTVANASDGQILSYDGSSSTWVSTPAPVSWPLKAMIPMYIYPTYLGSFWDVIEANPTNVEYVIANVDSGPGSAVNSDYTLHIGNMRAVGVKILGYVDTDYAGVDQSTVESQMETWTSYYTLDGFFLDRAQSTTGSETYYQALNAYAKNMDASFITVNNYGTAFAETYMSSADIHLITENTEANVLAGLPSLTDYEFVFDYPITSFAETIYDATSANLQADLAAVTKRHSGYVFVTPDPSYGTEPPFWEQEQTWLGGFNALGNAGGDLSGVYPNPTVAKLNGISLSGTPSSGQVLTATGANTANWQAVSSFLPALPAVYGLAMWTLPLSQADVTYGFTAQTLVAVLVNASTSATLTKLGAWVTTAGSDAGSGVNGLALYSEVGTRLAITGDMTAVFETTGYVEGTLTASYTISADTNYYLVYLNNFGTAPVLATDSAAGTYPVIRGHYPSVVAFGQTSFPTSFTPSSMTMGNLPLFLTAGT